MSKTATFLEIINDEDISEITIDNKILTQRFKNANTVNRTKNGFMFEYQSRLDFENINERLNTLHH